MRYRKYFLNHLLWLDDGFCQYYLQNPTWVPEEILDVQVVVFNWPEEAEQWLTQCAEHDPQTTFRHLRTYLADYCLENYPLNRMNNRQVLKAAARQICQNLHQIVIEPRIGWAVQVDPLYGETILPVSVEPEPDVGSLIEDLQKELNALVADQQKNFDEWEAKLANMSDEEKMLLYSKSAGEGLYDSIVGDTIDTVTAVAKGFPGFLKGYFKTLKKIAQVPSKIGDLTAEAIKTGSLTPFKKEIDKVITPIAETYEKAMEYKSMLSIIYNEPKLYGTLYDFAGNYWDATHPVGRTRMPASGISDVVITVILAIFTAGSSTAANVAVKSAKLAKVAKILEKITSVMKRIDSGSGVLEIGKDGLKKIKKKLKKPSAKNKNRMPDVENPKKIDKLDDGPKTEYVKKKDKDGPKTAATQKSDTKRATNEANEKSKGKNKPDKLLSSPIDDAKTVIDKSPTLKKQLSELKSKGWKIKYGLGKGSYLDRKNKLIVVSKTKKTGSSITRTLSHEIGHANYKLDPYVSAKGLSKEEYVKKNTIRLLKNEGEATLHNLEIRDEILSNNGPDIGCGGKRADEYKKIYEEYKSTGDREMAREKIGKIIADGERPSVDPSITYREYYSKSYEENYDKITKKKKQ